MMLPCRLGGTSVPIKLRAAIVLVLALITRAPAADSETAYAWQGSDLGGGQPAGSHTWDGKTLVVTGAGVGLNVSNADQVYFVHVGRPAGDFEVVVRLVDLSGEGDARAGIMARAEHGAVAAMAAVSFQVKGNGLGWMSRIPGTEPSGPPRRFSGGIQLANQPPLWLRMVRWKSNFAVYKSREGRLWSMISNVSGGPIAGPRSGGPRAIRLGGCRHGPARLSVAERRVPDLHGKQRLGRQEQLFPLAAVMQG